MSDLICIRTLCLLLRAVLLTELELRATEEKKKRKKKKASGECGGRGSGSAGRGVCLWGGGGYYAFVIDIAHRQHKQSP